MWDPTNHSRRLSPADAWSQPNHRSSLKQLFSALISESHNQLFEELFQKVSWRSPLVSLRHPFADTTRRRSSSQPDLQQTWNTWSRSPASNNDQHHWDYTDVMHQLFTSWATTLLGLSSVLQGNIYISPVNHGLNKPGHRSSCPCNRCIHIFDRLSNVYELSDSLVLDHQRPTVTSRPDDQHSSDNSAGTIINTPRPHRHIPPVN